MEVQVFDGRIKMGVVRTNMVCAPRAVSNMFLCPCEIANASQ